MGLTDTSTLVTDPFLRQILQTSAAAREAALALPSLIQHAASDPAPKSSSDPVAASPTMAVSRASKTYAAQLSLLRGHNRRLAQLQRATKQATAAFRAEVDTMHLSLQNLYYESRHLRGEIGACDAFPHPFMQLPMPTEAEFLLRCPEWVGRGDGPIMEARIEREHADRVEMEEARTALVARKVGLMRENAKRKEELGRLDADLERFIDAARPIQKTFEKEW